MMNLQRKIVEQGTIAHNTNALKGPATRTEHRVDYASHVPFHPKSQTLLTLDY